MNDNNMDVSQRIMQSPEAEMHVLDENAIKNPINVMKSNKKLDYSPNKTLRSPSTQKKSAKKNKSSRL